MMGKLMGLPDAVIGVDRTVADCAAAKALSAYATRADQRYFIPFARNFYAGSASRTVVLGINPGRRGSGLTGVPFTDGQSLAVECGIDNDFRETRELTSQFVYRVVRHAGGTRAFFNRVFLSAIYPYCLTVAGKNANYYDLLDRQPLLELVLHSLRSHRQLPNVSSRLVVVGQGRHLDLIRAVNDVHCVFDEITALPHPRFIVQYNRPKIEDFVAQYASALGF
jgi:hypothetical protein